MLKIIEGITSGLSAGFLILASASNPVFLIYYLLFFGILGAGLSLYLTPPLSWRKWRNTAISVLLGSAFGGLAWTFIPASCYGVCALTAFTSNYLFNKEPKQVKVV